MDREAWRIIHEAAHNASENSPVDYEGLIVDLFGPEEVGFGALRDQLVEAPLLIDRQCEVEEVIDSLLTAATT